MLITEVESVFELLAGCIGSLRPNVVIAKVYARILKVYTQILKYHALSQKKREMSEISLVNYSVLHAAR